MSAALNAFRNAPLEKDLFQHETFWFFGYPLHRRHVKFFKLSKCQPLFFYQLPAQCLPVTDIEVVYLVGVRLSWIYCHILLLHSDLISSKNKTFFHWVALSGNRKAHNQMLKHYKSFQAYCINIQKLFNVFNLQLCKCIKRNKITCLKGLVFFKPSRSINMHSLQHKLIWNVIWALAFPFTFLSNSCFVKIPILSFLFMHFVVIDFSCVPVLLKVVVIFLWWMFVSYVLLHCFCLLSNLF